MMRMLWVAAVVVGIDWAGAAQAIEVVNNSSRTVIVVLHRYHADNVGANFELYDYYWQTEGWWNVKPGKSVNLPGGSTNALCWMRMTFDSSKGEVIRPANPAAGPSSLIVAGKAFKFRRMGPDKNDTWRLTIEGKEVRAPGKSEPLTVKGGDAVRDYGAWVASGFYGYKSDTRFTVEGGGAPATPPVVAGGPDPSKAPAYGAATLKAGFNPDPYTKSVFAGGAVKTNLGGVQAYVGKGPDFVLNYTAGTYPLTFRVEAQADTTLLIRLPNGKWLANDDFMVLNPRIRLDAPQSGRYQIWVGTVSPENANARLFITEN